MTADSLHPNQLVILHQGLVRAIARGVQRSFPNYIDLDDLIGYGQLGLAQAARDFDPKRGIQFSTFAYYRIRGAILDGANQMNWLKRSARAADVYERLSGDVLANDTADAAAQGGATSDTNWIGDVGGKLAVIYLLSHGSDEGEQRLDPVDHLAEAPLKCLLDDELRHTLREALAALPDDARQLLQAAYFEGKTLKEAGEQLGISKAWASRLHARALDQLGRALRRAHVAE